MDNTSKLVLIGGVALSLVVVSRALGKTSPPIPPTALERQVMRHKDLIWRVGVQKDTDPALIAAIIAMESSGISRPARPITVRDYEGREKIDYVVGLMQVRVDTAGQYCHIWTRYDLQPDEVNVNCGVTYLRAMLDKFGAIAPAVSAYNAGAGRVEVDTSMVGGMRYVNLEYVRRVMEKIQRYRLLFMGAKGADRYMTLFPSQKWAFEIP